jgi:hypothetical protein
MNYSPTYGGVIWTNHALDRLKEREFSQEKARQAFYSPDYQQSGKKPGTVEYKKRFGTETVTVIATKNNRSEWVIISTWIDPPLPGTKDSFKKKRYIEYQKASNLKKIWLIIKEQLGF